MVRRKKRRRRSKRANYLIEFRFHGYAKKYAREMIFDISKKFHVRGITRKRPVPHITLFGPFSTTDEKRVVSQVKSIGRKYCCVPFSLSGFGYFDNKTDKVIYLDIRASEKLKQLRHELSKELKTITKSKSTQDRKNADKFYFHATIAFKDIDRKFKDIWSYVSNKKPPKINQYLLRITILKNSRILYEYDLIQQKLLNRKQALSRAGLKKTIEMLNKKCGNKAVFKHGHTEEREISKQPRKVSIMTKLIDFLKGNENGVKKITQKTDAYVISDLHLDHKNIIKFCDRPFKNVDEMNEAIVKNWNKTVGKEDTVFYLGDMSYGKGSRRAGYWLKQLNGNIVFIRGNHERLGRRIGHKQLILDYKGTRFYLIHDPALKPADWTEWLIHGHKHNSDLKGFPLLNKKNKTINVSAELLNYTPIKIDKLIKEVNLETVRLSEIFCPNNHHKPNYCHHS